MKVAVTGSSGLIGTALVASLRSDGHQVIRLVRQAPRSDDEVRWDPRAADAGLGAEHGALEGIGACVHLAGAGVASHRWTRRYKTEIRASRVLGTRALAGALARLASPPATLVAASAIGWYGETDGREVDETAPAGKTFLARLVRDWEAAADPAPGAGYQCRVHRRPQRGGRTPGPALAARARAAAARRPGRGLGGAAEQHQGDPQAPGRRGLPVPLPRL